MRLNGTMLAEMNTPTHLLHAVKAVGSHVLLLFIVGQQIIVAVVNDQGKRTDDVISAVAAFHLLMHVFDRKGHVFELDLLRFVRLTVQAAAHSLVDGINAVQYAAVVGLHAVCQEGVVFDAFRLMLTDHAAEGIDQSLGLTIRNKLGGIHTLCQESNIVEVILPLPNIKAFLLRVIDH